MIDRDLDSSLRSFDVVTSGFDNVAACSLCTTESRDPFLYSIPSCSESLSGVNVVTKAIINRYLKQFYHVCVESAAK
jgi:hypothetical protein